LLPHHLMDICISLMDLLDVLMLLTLVKLRKGLFFNWRLEYAFFLLSQTWVNFCYRYSMVLADNVDGGDDLDLIVTTMNGNVFCFSTPSPHHPLKAGYVWILIIETISVLLLNGFVRCFRHGDCLVKGETTLQIGTIVKVYMLLILIGPSVMRKAKAFGWKLRL